MSPSDSSPGSADQATSSGQAASKPDAKPAGKPAAAQGERAPGASAGKAAPAGSASPPGSTTQPVRAPAKSAGSPSRTAAPRRGRTAAGANGAAARPDEDTRPHEAVKAGRAEAPAGAGQRVPMTKPNEAPAAAGQAGPVQASPWSREEAGQRTTMMEPVNAGGYAPGSPPAGYAANPAAPVAAGAAAPPSAQTGRQMSRRARLKVSHLGPWSVLKVSLTFSLCMFIVLLVAVAALWAVLDSAGVFNSIVDAANTLTNDNKQTSIAEWLTFNRVMVIAVVLGAANVIAFTLLSTIGSLLYNLCSDFVGGIEVTLVER